MTISSYSQLNYGVTTGSYSNPATSASALAATGVRQSGQYFILCNGVPTASYVDFTLPGGPYILVMTTGGGTSNSFSYDSTVWSNTTGGSTAALSPTANADVVSPHFYHTPTSATGLALYSMSNTYFHYVQHTNDTARNLAMGTTPPTAVSPNNAPLAAGSLIPPSWAGAANGWMNAVVSAGYSSFTGSTYYRYGYAHGTPDPVQYGWCRFGWTADLDSSDSRDRGLGIGLKNAGGGPIGSFTSSGGFFDYSSTNKATIQCFLLIKN